MSRTLLDHNIPRPLARLLHGHIVRTAAQEGWEKLGNGALMQMAEEAGFEVFVTADKNLSYQNNPKGRRLSLIVISESAWPILQKYVAPIRAAIDAASPGASKRSSFHGRYGIAHMSDHSSL